MSSLARQSTPPPVTLRDVQPADLDTLFDWQSDPESCAQSFVKPRSRAAFDEIWRTLFASLADPSTGMRAKLILADNTPCGSIGSFIAQNQLCVGYQVARPFWKQGIATRALAAFLTCVPNRPLHARAAARNTASIKVLLKNGFRITGTKWGDETDRYIACEEIIFILC
ncbi:MAG TPA: GNAT family N-acetyltransferase [Phycisphaerales bacterium]